MPFEGTAGPCRAGGTEILAGPDTNLDGILEPTEVTATSFVCNGIGVATPGDAGDNASDVSLDVADTSADAPLEALESSSDAPACGDLASPCCATGAQCLPTSSSGIALGCQQGICVPCGALGGPCCSGARCNGIGAVCFQPSGSAAPVCAEAGTGNGPCASSLFCLNGASPGSACLTGFTCMGGLGTQAGVPVTSTCVPCGTLGQPCCTNFFDPMTKGIPTCGGQLCTDGSRCQVPMLQCVSP